MAVSPAIATPCCGASSNAATRTLPPGCALPKRAFAPTPSVSSVIWRAPAPPAGEAIAESVRHQGLLSEGGGTRFTIGGGRAVLTAKEAPGARPWPRVLVEAMLANYVVRGRAWTGGLLRARAAHFCHRRPRSIVRLGELFGCALLFEQEQHRIVFDRAMLQLPLEGADRALCGFLEELAAVRAAAAPLASPLGADVRAAIAAAIADGDEPTLARVALRVGVGARTLQRRLLGDGSRYQALVDQERLARALELLRRRELALADVAERLGFSEPRAFHRAFRRWTGRSPHEYRRGLDG